MSESKHTETPDLEDIAPAASHVGQVDDAKEQYDDVFGDLSEDGPNYRNVGWLASAVLMIKTQIGMGVLSIPSVFDTLGMIPGVICLCAVGVITTWSDYIVGVFKMNHREVYGIDDVGRMLFGPIGREVLAVAFCLYFTFISGSAMLAVSISINSLSEHVICTAVWVAIAAVVTFSFSSIQTLSRISWVAWVGGSCIIIAVYVVAIAVGSSSRPAAAPQTGPWSSDYKLFNQPSFSDAASAVSALVFAYAGTPAFFSIASEMRNPREYTKALITCQSVVTVTYVTIGIVVYYYAGSYVTSPAMGSAGPVIKKASYGIALPGLFATSILLIHVPSKYIFVRILRGTEHLTSNSLIHWATWLSSTFGVSMVAYLIASGIPVFGGLVSLVGALFGTFLSFQPMGLMWLYDNWSRDKRERTLRWRLMVAWSVFVVLAGTFLMIAGTYGSIVAIMDSYNKNGGRGAWSCADNSNST